MKIMLVSMPYTVAVMPSVAIAQLAAVGRQRLGNAVRIDSNHAFLDFIEFVGLDYYRMLGHFGKGLSEWLFRQAAFPVEDNVDTYSKFFFADGRFPRKMRLFEHMLEKRDQIDGFLDSLMERYRLDSYDVIGVTSMMSQNLASIALARKIKSVNPRVITLLGGANCEHPMGKAIAEHVPAIDFVFSGEALMSFPAFLQAMAAGRFDQIGAIRGVHARAYAETRAAAGAEGLRLIPLVDMRAAACHSELEANSGETYDMNQLPALDYDEYLARIDQSPELRKLKEHLIMPFQTSTGCWWADKIACSFCGLTPHAFRQMTSDKATAYINALIDKYEGRFALFEATDPCMPVEYPQEVFRRVNIGKRVILQYEVKARMSVSDMEALAAANVLLPQPGIESLSSRTLKLMRKGVSGLENVLFLRNCVEQGLYPVWQFLYGLPNKEYDEMSTGKMIDDIKSLLHLPPPAGAVHIAFQRYTEYFNDAATYGLKLRPQDQYYYLYPFDEGVVDDLAYTFVDPAYVRSFYSKHAGAIRALNKEIVTWMYRFKQSIPQLIFTSDLDVFDSRDQPSKQIRITSRERDLLRFLNEPQSLKTIARQFGWPAADVEHAIGSLVESRLVFHDAGRYLSLVCDKCALVHAAFERYYTSFITNTSIGFE